MASGTLLCNLVVVWNRFPLSTGGFTALGGHLLDALLLRHTQFCGTLICYETAGGIAVTFVSGC